MPPHVRRLLADIEKRMDEEQAQPETAQPDPGYEVGYGRPPKATQFQKGKPSPNRRGRPRTDKALQQLLRETFSKTVAVTIDGKKKRMQLNKVILQRLVKKAVDGDMAAIKQAIELQKLITPIRPEPVVNTEEEQKKQELAEKLSKFMVSQLEDFARRKRAEHQRKRDEEPPEAVN